MHVLPRVRELEERFPEQLVVIGVHAGKFSAERLTRNLEAACGRLGVHHAVVNDRQFRIWKQYAIQAWPTVALIDAEGTLVGVQSGRVPGGRDGRRDRARSSSATASAGAAPRPRSLTSALARQDTGALQFPTRVIADGQRRWVSDAGHGRVCELRLAAATAGGRSRCGTDFVEPQGLARLGGQTLRGRPRGPFRLPARRRRATTARRGHRGASAVRLLPGRATDIDLRSPWGLSALPNGDLAIAMAGSHQLWRLERDRFGGFDEAEMSLLAGAGGEDTRRTGRRELAPRATDRRGARTARSSHSPTASPRRCGSSISTEPTVATLVGTGLFDFGDRDGHRRRGAATARAGCRVARQSNSSSPTPTTTG